MAMPIRILHLEDDPRDAMLIRDLLDEAGVECDIVLVDSQCGFTAALHEHAFDVIICDYCLPGFDGLSALKLATASVYTPVVVVSGQISPTEAVACLHAGATDYVLKQQLERLPSAVTRAVEDATQRRLRREAEQSLAESEERFRQLAENSQEGFWFVALNPVRMLYLNPAMQTISGLSSDQLLQHPREWLKCIHPEDRESLQTAWRHWANGERMGVLQQCRMIRPDGSERWVQISCTPIRDASGVVRLSGLVLDTTELKNLERQFLRAQRLESIGTLAGGIAHDLNNMLAPILLSADLLKLSATDARSRTLLNMIGDNVRRGADLVGQVLAFARGRGGTLAEVQVRQLLLEFEKMVRETFPKNITVRLELGSDEGAVLADPTQLHQILLNLCVNARDAMPAGGRITISVMHMMFDRAQAAQHALVNEGPYVVIQVEDTGPGIPKDIIDKVFDPFFSTKTVDQGTGLGLSTSRKIAVDLGGSLAVTSEPGGGARFRICLPVLVQKLEVAPVGVNELPRGQGETVLFVDDEVALREIMRRTLEAYDYRVCLAGDGAEAVALYAAQRREIAVVVIDMLMPEMDGLSAIKRLRDLNPSVRILAISGFTPAAEVASMIKDGAITFVAKPYTTSNLLVALRRAIA